MQANFRRFLDGDRHSRSHFLRLTANLPIHYSPPSFMVVAAGSNLPVLSQKPKRRFYGWRPEPDDLRRRIAHS